MAMPSAAGVRAREEASPVVSPSDRFRAMAASVQPRQSQSLMLSAGRSPTLALRGAPSASVGPGRASVPELSAKAAESLGSPVLPKPALSEPQRQQEVRALLPRARPPSSVDSFSGAALSMPSNSFLSHSTPQQDYREACVTNAATPQPESLHVALAAARSLPPGSPTDAALRRSSPGTSPTSAGGRSPAMALSLSRRALSSEYIQQQAAQPQPQQLQQQPQQQQQLSPAVQAGWSTYESPERRPSAGDRRPAQKARQLSDGQRDLGGGALKTPRPQSPVSARGLEDQRPQRRSLGLPPWKRPTHRVEGTPVTPAQPAAAAAQTAARPGQGIPEGGPVVGPAALSAAVPQSSVLIAASRESGWQASVRQVRQELLAQRSAQAEALALEARVRRKELEAQQAAQLRAGGEQVATLRFETELSLRQERESRMGEAAELRAALEQLKAKVLDLQEAERTPTQASQSVGWTTPSLSGAGQGHELWPPPTQGVEGLARDLEAERLNRCSKDADIHARIGREVSDLGRRLEEQYRALGEEIADASRQMEERRLALEKALETEREDRARESNELRAILETVWQRAAMVPDAKEKDTTDKKYYFRYDEGPGEESYKELVGDQEDINTLYEMVREALGDTVGLRQEIGEERESRRGELLASRQQLERLERQFNTLQTLVQQATPLASARELGSPETAERQQSPSASAPTSPGVETRKLRRDSSVETIRNEFATRLEDHRKRLMDHLEEQLAAGQSAQNLHRSEMMGHVEAHMADILRDLSARVESSEAALRREVRTIVEEVREQLRDVRLRSPTHQGTAETSLQGAMQDQQQLGAEQALPPATSSALWQKPQGEPQPLGSGGLQPSSGALQVGSSNSLRDRGDRPSMGLNRHFT